MHQIMNSSMDVKFGITIREAHVWRVSEEKVLRIIFEPHRVGVTGDWRIAYNELYIVT